MIKFLKIIILIVLVVVAIAFMVLNKQSVQINYLLATDAIQLSYIVIATLMLGFFSGLLFALANILKLKAQQRSLNKNLKQRDIELENLRRLPENNAD